MIKHLAVHALYICYTYTYTHTHTHTHTLIHKSFVIIYYLIYIVIIFLIWTLKTILHTVITHKDKHKVGIIIIIRSSRFKHMTH